MTNRIVRALLGVALAKAAILGSWYLYQKAEKQGQEGKDDTAEAQTEVAAKTETVAEEVAPAVPAKKTRARKPAVKAEVKKEAPAKKVAAKKTARKTVARKATPKADSAE
jgi:hypothetical protein